jgi:hypothetical protein
LSRNVAYIAAMMDSGVEFVACDNPTLRLPVSTLVYSATQGATERREVPLRRCLLSFKAEEH